MKTKSLKRGKAHPSHKLEREYQKIIENVDDSRIIPAYQTLLQPTPYRAIQTFTTYGAYEDPI